MSSLLNTLFGNRKSPPISLETNGEDVNGQEKESSVAPNSGRDLSGNNGAPSSSNSNKESVIDHVEKSNSVSLQSKKVDSEVEDWPQFIETQLNDKENLDCVKSGCDNVSTTLSDKTVLQGDVVNSSKCEINQLTHIEQKPDAQNYSEGESSDGSSVNSNNYGNEISSADFKEDDLEGGRKKRRGKRGRGRRVRHEESKLLKERSEKMGGNVFDSDNTGNDSPSQVQTPSNDRDKEGCVLPLDPVVPPIPPLKTTWRNDNKTLQSKLKFILFHESNSYCDVSFLVGAEKQEILAHKFILSVSSQVFEDLIIKSEKDNIKQIVISDTEPLVFKELLQFIYTDTFESKKCDDIEFALSLMSAAKTFKVPELNTCIGKLMKSKLTAKNVIRIYERGEGCVMGDAQQFIMLNAKTVFNTDEFLTLSHPKLCKLLINNNLMLDELTIFNRTVYWAKEECTRMGLEENPENLRGVLHSAIYLIRFPLLTAQEFTFHVLPHGILSESEQLEIFKYFSVRETPIQSSIQLQLKFNCTKRSPIPNVKKQTPLPIEKQTAAKTSQAVKPALMQLPIANPLASPALSNPFPVSSGMIATPPKLIIPPQSVTQPQTSSPINNAPVSLKPSVAEKQIRSEITKEAEVILGNLNDSNFSDSIQSFKKLQLCNNEGRVDCFVRVLFRKLAERSNMCHLFAKFMLFALQLTHQPTTRLKKQFLEHSQCVFERKTAYDGIVTKLKLRITNTDNEQEKLDLIAKYEIKNTNLRLYYLANVRFMGELFKVQLLTPAIIVDSVNSLLQTADDDSLESICHLLKTCGEKLDLRLQQHSKLSKAMSAPEFPCGPNWMDNVFGQLVNIFNNIKHLRFEIRLMLIELIEIRQNGWKPAGLPNTLSASASSS